MTPTDLVSFGIFGVLAFVIVKQQIEIARLTTELANLVKSAITALEGAKTAIERLDNQRLLELTETIKEIRRADRVSRAKQTEEGKSPPKASA